MKSIVESINEVYIQHGDLYITRGRKRGWMQFDDASGTVMVFSADKLNDLALEFSADEDAFDGIWRLKPAETYKDPQTGSITTCLW